MKFKKDLANMFFANLSFFIILIPFPIYADQSLDILRPPTWTKNQFILSLGRLSTGNDFIDRYSNSLNYNIECAVTNSAAKNTNFFIDYESDYCGFYLENSYKKARFSINTGAVRTGGGVFDSSIETFHGIFNFPNGSRGRIQENDYNVNGNLQSSGRYDVSQTDFAIIDPQLSISYPIYENHESKLFIEGSSTIPLSSQEFSLTKPDFKLNLVFEKRKENSYAYQFGISNVLHLDRNHNSIPSDLLSYGSFVSVQFQFVDSIVFLIQTVVSSSLQNNLPGFYDYEIYLDTGIRFKIIDNNLIDLILRENPSPGNGTADVSLILNFGF
jgi:hypothetical protein